LRVVAKDLKHGVVKVVPESSDDIWLLATIIQPGDFVRARTFREVHFGDRGSGRSSRVPMVLTVRVERVEFQPFTTRLRVRGVVVEGPERYGVKGKYHTLSLDVGDEVVIVKPQGWSRALLRKLEEQGFSEAAVVVAIDYDEYAVAVVRGQGVRIVDSGSLRLPGKDDPGWGERLQEALNVIAKTVRAVVEREKPLLVVVAGPGSVKEMLAERLRPLLRGVRLVVDNVSMGGEAGVYEELRRGLIRQLLREAASIVAERLVEEFEKRLAKEPQRVAYTLDMVEKAVEAGAAEEILVLDELLHSPDPEIRRRVEEVLRKADESRAKIHFVSMESPVGFKLKALGGIIALLRYPLDLSW
jgi:protein pelota